MNKWFVDKNTIYGQRELYMLGIDGNLYMVISATILEGALLRKMHDGLGNHDGLFPLSDAHQLTKQQLDMYAFMNANPNIVYDPLWDGWSA